MALRKRQRVFRPDRRRGGRRCPGEASTPLVLRIRHRRPGAIGMLVIDAARGRAVRINGSSRSEEHTSELQSLMRISYAVFCLKKKKRQTTSRTSDTINN